MSLDVIAQEMVKADTVTLNGRETYYEVYGRGEPLFLLHGYGQSSQYWSPYVSHFKEDFKVYLVDLLGHGSSKALDSDWSVQAAVNNIYDLVRHLDLEQIKAMGLSYGGDILYQLAADHPSLVKSMVTIGAIGTWDANDYPSYLEYFSHSNLENLGWMKDFQSTEEHFNGLLNYFSKYQTELSDHELQKIKTDVLIVLGDDDESIPLEEVIRVRKKLLSSDLWIVPNSPHVAFEGQYKSDFIKMSKEFLLGN